MFNNDGQQQPTTDEEGRLSLLAQVSRTSLCFWFFVLMWRAIHHYELADAYRRHSSFSSLSLFVLIIPTATLFLLNMAGCVASFTSPKHKTKKRLKAILNVNKLVEVVLFIYNLGRMTIVPPLFTTSKKFVPKEVYVARLVHNVLYVIASQAFTRVTWDATHEMSSTVPSSSYGGGGYGEGIGYDSGYGYGYNDDNDYGGGSAVEDFQGGARRRRQRDIGSTASYPSSHQPYFSTGGYADYGAQDSRNRMYDNENQE